MTGSRSSLPVRQIGWTLTPLLVFGVLLLALNWVNGPESEASEQQSAALPEVSGGGDDPALPGDTAAQVTSLQQAVQADPQNADTYALLGDALYQRYREIADPSLIQQAQIAADRAIAIDPDNVTAVIEQGTLALTRHDFSAALDYGRRAHRLEPALVRPYNVIADAQIELGRYDAAARTLQRFVNLKPGLAAYSRVSYFRELNGDIPGATQAMQLAVSTGGGGEPLSYVQTLLGRLKFNAGHLDAAALQYREALQSDPEGSTRALAGLAQIDAARGSFGPAIRRYRDVVERLPLPEYAIALAETELAAGRKQAAQDDFDLVETEEKLFRAAGVNVDVELALFEADHGQPKQAVSFGSRTWRQAPSVRSADAYSWALLSAGRTQGALEMSRNAMKLGSQDPSFLYHAGQIALAAGELDRARDLLGRLVALNPHFNPLFGPRAERAFASL